MTSNAVVKTLPPTAAQRAKAEDNLRKAKVQLVLHQPFLGNILCRRTLVIDDSVETAYSTAAGKIVVGTVFFAGLTVQEAMGLLAHEAMHYGLMHHMRVGWRKPRQANIAMDKVINDIIKHSGLELPPEGAFQDGAREYAWEQLYDENEQGGEGQGQGPYAPGHGNDDLSQEGVDSVSSEQVQQIKQELIQARQAAKKQGNMSAALEKLIDELIDTKTPWHALTERFMTALKRDDMTWARPRKNRLPVYLPSVSKRPAMDTVVIQSDESGSIDATMLKHFGGHINRILETCAPERVIVLHTDTEVRKVEEFAAEDFPIEFVSYAAGGTDMTAGFRWCEENDICPDVFVCLTDGYTPFGEPQQYPVLWLITASGVMAPHGETIPYEVTEE